jgi:ATP-dependent Clp protease ATP-binding subunit ClpC
MFERFTERARQVIVLAQDEARALKHNYIGTEHLLLGLLREEEGLAARVLERHGIDLDSARGEVSRIIGQGDQLPTGGIPFTPRTKAVLELALQDSLRLGHSYIGTEHILIGLLHEGRGLAVNILRAAGADPDEVWATIHRDLGVDSPPPRPERESQVELDIVGFDTAVEGRREWIYDWWPPMLLGATLFAAGLLVGWLIWG